MEYQQYMEAMHNFDDNSYYLFKMIICTPFNQINRGSLEFGHDFIIELITRNFDPYFNTCYTDKPNICTVCGMIHKIDLTKDNFIDMYERYNLCTYEQIVNRMTTCFSSFL